MELKRKDLVDDLAIRCGFYKSNADTFLKALDDMLVEKLGESTLEEDVRIHLARGIVIGSKRLPEREAVDPRNQKPIIAKEKSIPYAEFTQTFRQKINE